MKINHLLSLIFLFLLISCGKDKDTPKPNEEENSQALLLGNWRCTKIIQTDFDSTNKVIFSTEEHNLAGGPGFNFNGQGILEEGEFYLGSFKPEKSGTYTLNGKVLNINANDFRKLYTGSFRIDTLNASYLSFNDTIYNIWSINLRKGYRVNSFKATR